LILLGTVTREANGYRSGVAAIAMSMVLLALLFFAFGLILGRLDVAKLRVSWEVQHRLEWVLALGMCGALYFWGIYYPLSLLLKKRHGPRQDQPKAAPRRSSWPLAYSNKLQFQ